MATYDAFNALVPGEFTSARDDGGHGTHTASTAAGNGNVAASIFGISRGIVSGIAPRAHVMAYKVCGEAGCYGSDSAAAIQKAILDGVNVINFSISGGANPYSDAVERAFLDAYAAGVFVAASAGNSGPGADTTDHRGPWVTTVAASTADRAFTNMVTLNDGGASLSLKGTSLTPGVGPAPVVDASTAPYNDPLCLSNTADGAFAGKIVICKRGTNGRAEKGYNVKQRGAVGMILYNQSAAVTDLETDNHYLPATHIQYTQGQQVVAFVAAHPSATATLTAGVKDTQQGDVMASFSSRGGPNQPLGVSKPDITAPGVQILAGNSPQHVDIATGPQGELFQAIAGTSMSSPHIAGAGALLKALHPNWTPGQIKSALMTTAWTKVVKEDGVTPANAFDDGSGRVDLRVAGDPGFTFDVTAADYVAHQNDLWNVNYPSVYIPSMPGIITVKRTAHSILPKNSVWELKVSAPKDVKISVPSKLVVGANSDVTFSIVIDGSDVPVGQTRFATVTLLQQGNGDRVLHIPVTFNRKQQAVTLDKSCAPADITRGATTTCTITAQNNAFGDANVTITDVVPKQLQVVTSSVTGASVRGNTITFSGALAGATPPDVTVAAIDPNNTPGGYYALGPLGIPAVTGVGDDTMTNFNVPSFTYAGQSYSRIGISSNGIIVVGGGTAAEATPANQNLPNTTPPNNVLAGFWTDLNPAAAGAVRVATLSGGGDTWIVVEWDGVPEYSTGANKHSFQIWLGLNTDANPAEDITMTYGANTGDGDLHAATIGAENSFGTKGGNIYFNGTGTLPTATPDSLAVLVTGSAPVPGAAQVITFSATGKQKGAWVNYAQMQGDTFPGTSVARFAGTVK